MFTRKPFKTSERNLPNWSTKWNPKRDTLFYTGPKSKPRKTKRSVTLIKDPRRRRRRTQSKTHISGITRLAWCRRRRKTLKSQRPTATAPRYVSIKSKQHYYCLNLLILFCCFRHQRLKEQQPRGWRSGVDILVFFIRRFSLPTYLQHIIRGRNGDGPIR